MKLYYDKPESLSAAISGERRGIYLKPIIFNTETVRAILDGRKTVTRRVIKPQPLGRIAYIMAGYKHGLWGYPGSDTYKYWGDEWKKPEGLSSEESNRHWAPPCHTDDILYVRETWGDYRECTEDGGGVYVLYRADYPDGAKQVTHPDGIVYELPKWHPSIHMPKGAARIFLRVTDVRVERLLNMTDEDARQEGCQGIPCDCKNAYIAGGSLVCTDCLNTGNYSVLLRNAQILHKVER